MITKYDCQTYQELPDILQNEILTENIGQTADELYLRIPKQENNMPFFSFAQFKTYLKKLIKYHRILVDIKYVNGKSYYFKGTESHHIEYCG